MEEALASLSAQKMGDDLEVIVQDGTTGYTEHTERNDSLQTGVRSFGVEGLRYFREEDLGQSDALNKGFAKAKGEWLFWLNADDVLLPSALKRVLDRINKIDRIDWIAGDTVYIDEKGIVKEVRTDAKWRPWFGKRMSVWTGGPSAFFRRELWERLGGFDTSLKYVMDIDLWTRWAQAGAQFDSLGACVWGFREHQDSKTGSGVNRDAQLIELKSLEKKYGVASRGFWRSLTRALSIVDGSWLKRKFDSYRLRGKHWRVGAS